MPIQCEVIPGNPHVQAVEALFGPFPKPPIQPPPGIRFVFICFTNRSGSNHLAEALMSDGRLNMAGEFFNAEAIEADVRLHGHRSFADYLWRQIQWRQVGGRLAAKIATSHLELLCRLGALDSCDAHYVHVTRADRLGQAISHSIAEQTRQWTSAAPGDPARSPRYDRRRIAEIMREIDEANAVFDRFFAANGIAATHVEYEALTADPAAVVARVGEAIGLPGLKIVPSAMRLAPQAGPRNRSWRKRFAAGL